jgi:ammonium transporter, Amt family
VVGALFIIGWNIIWTSAIMAFIKYALRIPLRMPEDVLLAGSEMVHGEVPYTFEPCAAHAQLLAGQNARSEVRPSEIGMGGVILGQDPHPLKQNSTEPQEIKID